MFVATKSANSAQTQDALGEGALRDKRQSSELKEARISPDSQRISNRGRQANSGPNPTLDAATRRASHLEGMFQNSHYKRHVSTIHDPLAEAVNVRHARRARSLHTVTTGTTTGNMKIG